MSVPLSYAAPPKDRDESGEEAKALDNSTSTTTAAGPASPKATIESPFSETVVQEVGGSSEKTTVEMTSNSSASCGSVTLSEAEEKLKEPEEVPKLEKDMEIVALVSEMDVNVVSTGEGPVAVAHTSENRDINDNNVGDKPSAEKSTTITSDSAEIVSTTTKSDNVLPKSDDGVVDIVAKEADSHPDQAESANQSASVELPSTTTPSASDFVTDSKAASAPVLPDNEQAEVSYTSESATDEQEGVKPKASATSKAEEEEGGGVTVRGNCDTEHNVDCKSSQEEKEVIEGPSECSDANINQSEVSVNQNTTNECANVIVGEEISEVKVTEVSGDSKKGDDEREETTTMITSDKDKTEDTSVRSEIVELTSVVVNTIEVPVSLHEDTLKEPSPQEAQKAEELVIHEEMEDPISRPPVIAEMPPPVAAVKSSRPKLLANLKPKSPHSDVEDDQFDIQEEQPPPKEVADKKVETPITDSAQLPMRSSVVVVAPRQTQNPSHNSSPVTTPDTSCSLPSPKLVVESREEPNTYINKRSSLYVNSPDFSKKSNLLSPAGASSSVPQGGPSFRANSTPVVHVDLVHKSELRPEHTRPPVVMHLKGGNQREVVQNNLSTLKMKTPDFSKINSPAGTVSHAKPPPPSQYNPSVNPAPQNAAVDPYNFHEIRKKYNYISDLQLKPPSEPVPVPPQKSYSKESAPYPSSHQQTPPNVPRDSYAPPVSSYPNLYVNTPEFTTQKFVAVQRHGDGERYPTSVAGTRQQPVAPGRDPSVRGHPSFDVFPDHAMHGSGVVHHSKDSVNRVAYASGNFYPDMRQVPNKLPEENLLGRGGQLKTETSASLPRHDLQIQRYPYHSEGASSNNPSRSSSIRPSYTGGVPRNHGYEVSPQHRPPHEVPSAQHTQSPSVISLKQQQTDILRTDLKRIHSPNQAASVGVVQMAPQMYPPSNSHWTQQRPTNQTTAAPGSPYYHQQPSHSKSSPSPSTMGVYPAIHGQREESPRHPQSPVMVPTADSPHQDYYKSRPMGQPRPVSHEPSVKYASTGDLSRVAPGPSHTVRYSSVDRYSSGNLPEVKLEVRPEHYLSSSSEYLSQQSPTTNERFSRAHPHALPQLSAQVPPNNYQKFNHGALHRESEPIPTNLTKAPVEVLPPPQQPHVVQSTNTSSVAVQRKRESPLDLSVKTVKTKADSTGEYYDGSLGGVSSMAVHSKPTTSLKVNYVPNFGQHQRQNQPPGGFVESMAGRPNHSSAVALVQQQQHHPVSVPMPRPVQNSVPRQEYPHRDRSYVDSRRMNVPSPSNVGDISLGEPKQRQPIMGYSGSSPHALQKSQYIHEQEAMHPHPPREMNPKTQIPNNQFGPGPPPLAMASNSRFVEVPQFKSASHSISQAKPDLSHHPQLSHPPQQHPSTQVRSTWRPEPTVPVERKRHADFAHLSGGNSAPVKTMKVNDPYRPPSFAVEGSSDALRSKDTPYNVPNHLQKPSTYPYQQQQQYRMQEASRNDKNYDQTASYINAHFNPNMAVKKEHVQLGSSSSAHSVTTVPDATNLHYPVHRAEYLPHGQYQGELRSPYIPSSHSPHPKMGAPGNANQYPGSHLYHHRSGISPSLPQPSLLTPSHDSLQYPRPEYQQPPAPPPPTGQQQSLHLPPHSYDRRPLVSPPKVSGGADRSVISKLKTTIEEKQHQRLVQKQISVEGVSDESKGDIASILAARIRTKGELKGYTGPPQQTPQPRSEEPEVKINPKERFNPPADMDGVTGFDLMDWGSACNDFVEQLQTGKKKTKRKRPLKSSDGKSDFKNEPSYEDPERTGHGLESVVPKEAIASAAGLVRNPAQGTGIAAAASEGSSDEDKPLVLIRQLSLEKAKVTESDANSLSSSLLMSGKSGGTAKGVKQKRLLQEKRYAARIANASSSDSESEKAKPQKPFKRKKNLHKTAKVNSIQEVSSISRSENKSENDLNDISKTVAKKDKKAVTSTSQKILKSSSDSQEETLSKKPDRGTKTPTTNLDRGKAAKKALPEASDSEKEGVSPSKKSKNAMAAKSLSDAEGKVGCSKDSPSPRTPKMRRTTSKDVGPSSSGKSKSTKDQKSAPEEHMTRSRKKLEQTANSLVLRNEKTVTKALKNKPGPKRKNIEETKKKGGKLAKMDLASSSSSDAENQASDGTSSSDSEADTVISVRLRPRKAKSNDREQITRHSAVERRSGDGLSKTKSEDNEKKAVQVESQESTNNPVPGKRGPGKKSRPEGKGKPAAKEAESVTADHDQGEKNSRAPKGRKNSGDPEKFSPGWEDQLYEFKRSLKVPASLITIESPKWHRVSTSLPDLEPRSNSEDEDLEASMENKITKASPESTIVKKSSSTLGSIIDLVHQRVILPIKLLAHIASSTTDTPDTTAVPVALEKRNDLLLPTPVLVKTSRPKGNDAESMEHIEEVVGRNVFQNKSPKKSRTRREYNVEKNKEIIREIFGGEDRPASAPPGCGPLTELKDHPVVREYEAIINKMSYEQKFEEYLGLYSTPEETSSVSNKSLQLAMSIDEAIKEDVTIFQRPIVQGEDPVHGGLVKRRVGRRGHTRRKGSSGFDYIRKKKRPVPANVNSLSSAVNNEVVETTRQRAQISFVKERSEQDISKEIKGWVLNKGVGESVLHKATRMNLLDVVAYCLIRIEMTPDQKDNAGYTPLHEACSRGHLDIARLLLQHGANPSETSPSGIRPLHDAVENGDMEIVRLLLAYGADAKLATYAGQTPLDLAEDDEDMEKFLVDHMNDLYGTERNPWKFEGAWKPYYDPEIGFNVLHAAPEVDHSEGKTLQRRRGLHNGKDFSCEFDTKWNWKKSSALNQTVKKLSEELNGIAFSGDISEVDVSQQPGCNSEVLVEPTEDQANSDDGDEIFEVEECETPLPPVYFLEDPSDKWCMLTDLQNLLKFKSKETLLKQICPPDGKKEELVREYKMNDFLQKATCLQLLCSGEKLNIRASKVSLIKYTEPLKNLLGVHTVVMRL